MGQKIVLALVVLVNKNITGIVACEFTMAESDFLDFAAQHEWQIGKLESSASMTGYTWFVEEGIFALSYTQLFVDRRQWSVVKKEFTSIT